MDDDIYRCIRRGILVLAVSLLSAATLACAGSGEDTGAQGTESEADSAEQRARPGPLRAVDAARAASDSMASRAAQMDTAR